MQNNQEQPICACAGCRITASVVCSTSHALLSPGPLLPPSAKFRRSPISSLYGQCIAHSPKEQLSHPTNLKRSYSCFKLFSIVSHSTPACAFPNVNIGRSLTVRSPHPPICTPLLRIRPTNLSRCSGLAKSQLKNVPSPCPRKFSMTGFRLKMVSRSLTRAAPVDAVCWTRLCCLMREMMERAWRARIGSPCMGKLCAPPPHYRLNDGLGSRFAISPSSLGGFRGCRE